MVKDHSDSERGNPLPPHRLLFPINSKGSVICTYHSLCYTSRGALAGMINSSMGPPWRIDPTTHRTMSERSTSQLRPAPEGSIDGYLGDGYDEVELEGEDGSGEEDDKHDVCSVFEIGQLTVHRPELHPPANVRVGGRGLEPHRLPVRRLNVLKNPQTQSLFI